MTNQEIVDQIEFSLPPLPADIREKILDAVYEVLADHRADPDSDA